MPLSATTAAAVPRVRHGFSLVELLVVLGIIAMMASLVLGGLFRSRDSNRLLAAEQVLADAIRQGRHTARSTGSPVEVRLTPVLSGSQVTGARLGGTSRTVLWSETFDKVRDVNDDSVIDDIDEAATPSYTDGSDGVEIGRSGNGRVASALHPIMHQLTRETRLVRGGPSDGFYFACSVQPPMNAGAPGTIIPLALIGDDGSLASSQCGIALKSYNLSIHGPLAGTVVWDVVGWVYDDAGNEVAINASTDPVRTRAGIETLPSGENDLAHPLIGGRWVDVGLLYDGRRLVLYLDGVRIAERRTGIPAKLRAEGDQLHIGSLLIPGAPPSVTYSPVPLDDVRLYRLGTADVADLPGNVVLVSAIGAAPSATLGWRILCQPDGRVEVSRDDDVDAAPINDRGGQPVAGTPRTGDTATILLGQLRAPGTLQNAELTVTLDGRVHSRLVTAPAPNGMETTQ